MMHVVNRARNTVICRVFRRSYGFESSPYMEESIQNSLLEKSIRAGCTSLYTRSSMLPHQVASTYELLSDLSATEEVNLSEFTLGHCCASPTVEGMNKDVDDITAAMGKNRKLDYMTFSVNPGYDVKAFEEMIAQGTAASLGFHFPTSTLQTSSGLDIDRVLGDLSGVLDGHTESPTFSIAVNYLTFENASKVADWAKMQGVSPRLIASEVLRIHDRRPSLLSAPIQKGGSAATGSPSRTSKAAMLDAMENLKVSFDRCIHMEMQYIDRLSTSLPERSEGLEVNIHNLCVGHALMQSQSNILSTEEWKYLLHSRIEPQWKDAMDSVRSKSKETAEWASLYSSLAKHLFASFSEMQDTRKYLMLEDVLTEIHQQQNGSDSMTLEEIERQGADLPLFLGEFAQNYIHADEAMLSGVEITRDHSSSGELNVEPEELFQKIEASCRTYV